MKALVINHALHQIEKGDRMIQLPSKFVKTITDIHKEKGEEWLANFDVLIAHCEERWKMKIMPPFDLSYNFVAPAKADDGKDLVIKLTVPNEEFLSEVSALKEFNGNGMVSLIDSDLEKGVLILERLIPGETLVSIKNEDEAVLIASSIMKKLWRPAPKNSNLQSIIHRLNSLMRISQQNPEGIGPIMIGTIQEAVDIFKELANTQTDLYLLHGDLHHYNILHTSKDTWLAIDPKGLFGEREYDTIQFLLNNLENKDILTVIDKRVDLLVDQLALDKKRLLLWGFAHAVLSTCWSLEDEGTYNEHFYKAIFVFKELYSKYYLD
ncbi:aminoglycoside phosphotransferase family protein [Gottfriedia solisilvae]|nr:aminoglycoside phosphotransferase family protein [Gottfriedia solisilvae]